MWPTLVQFYTHDMCFKFLRINNLFGTHEMNKHDQNQSVNSTSRVLVSLKLLAAH